MSVKVFCITHEFFCNEFNHSYNQTTEIREKHVNNTNNVNLDDYIKAILWEREDYHRQFWKRKDDHVQKN